MLTPVCSTTYLSLDISPFLKPIYKGKEHLTCPAFSFLIEHKSGKKILFDLGVRKDWGNLVPSTAKHIKELGWTVKVDKNIAEILTEHGVEPESIESVIWSHHHWDHNGDMTTFPGTTELVVGPGFKGQYLPGYPTNKDAAVLQSDFDNRNVREIDIASEGKGLKIGRFEAYDYFGDGSFYLLHTPGHSVGHICGLARTSTSPPSFVLMGGDACHHGGEFRPSDYLPLPKEIKPSPIAHLSPACPGHLLQQMHREKSATTPFYQLTETFAHDTKVAEWTISGLQEFDASDEVFIVLAHDESLVNFIEFYPKCINDWRKEDYANKARWRFVGDYEEAVADVK